MEKTITIDNKKITMKASAMTPRLYLTTFKKDMLTQLSKLSKIKVDENGEATLNDEMAELFLEVAYIMAKQGKDPTTEGKTFEEWLDEFSLFGIYQALPEIYELWGANITTTVTAKKKKDKQLGK